ncbi:MAG: hypothetical protein EOO05_10945 [Chitinophagaceae bacterium]|nr:MAG: hypothetical protein EOO05_10945 [Chitinophagaceae bacterium]
MATTFTKQDIITYLESTGQEDYHFHIDLEHPYFFPAGSRLTLFADDTRWALVFEKAGYGTGNSCGQIELCYFGNCLRNLTDEVSQGKTSNMKIVILIDYDELQRIQQPEAFEVVSRGAIEVRVRNRMLSIEHDFAKYRARYIDPVSLNEPFDLVTFEAMIRYLDETNPGLFRATDQETRECIPMDLPRLMHIDDWHQERYQLFPDYSGPDKWEYKVMGTKPGDYETFPMIADILVSKDISRWKPTLPPTNNWRNWPQAGYM